MKIVLHSYHSCFVSWILSWTTTNHRSHHHLLVSRAKNEYKKAPHPPRDVRPWCHPNSPGYARRTLQYGDQRNKNDLDTCLLVTERHARQGILPQCGFSQRLRSPFDILCVSAHTIRRLSGTHVVCVLVFVKVNPLEFVSWYTGTINFVNVKISYSSILNPLESFSTIRFFHKHLQSITIFLNECCPQRSPHFGQLFRCLTPSDKFSPILVTG